MAYETKLHLFISWELMHSQNERAYRGDWGKLDRILNSEWAKLKKLRILLPFLSSTASFKKFKVPSKKLIGHEKV
jgi:hypothetical protein